MGICRRGGERNGRDFLKVNKKQKINIFDLAETLARKMAENHIRKGMWELRACRRESPRNEWQHSRDTQMHISQPAFESTVLQRIFLMTAVDILIMKTRLPTW